MKNLHCEVRYSPTIKKPQFSLQQNEETKEGGSSKNRHNKAAKTLCFSLGLDENTRVSSSIHGSTVSLNSFIPLN